MMMLLWLCCRYIWSNAEAVEIFYYSLTATVLTCSDLVLATTMYLSNSTEITLATSSSELPTRVLYSVASYIPYS